MKDALGGPISGCWDMSADLSDGRLAVFELRGREEGVHLLSRMASCMAAALSKVRRGSVG
jgi:hypothetical protein